MTEYYQWQGSDLLLNLYVQPGAKTNELIGEYGKNLKVRITAQPVENKANKHLLKFLAKTFAVSVSQVKLISGEHQRSKRVRIVNPATLPAHISSRVINN